MGTIGNKIKRRREELGLSQEQLAEKAGVSQPLIHKLESGKALETKKLNQIANALDVSAEWLLGTVERGRLVKDELSNLDPPPRFVMAPLISWIQAGHWSEAIDNYAPGDAEEWLPCATRSAGPHTYALRVKGDSMTNQYGRSYPHGCIIFVDPDRVGGVVSGDRVIARINSDNEAIFKVYVEDAGKRFLKPLNPQYPPISDEFEIIGKVIGKYEPE